MTRVWLVAMTALVGCAGEPTSIDSGGPTGSKDASIVADTTAQEAEVPAAKVEKEKSPLESEKKDKPAQTARPSVEPLHFMDFVATNCLVDRLEYTEYAVGWIKWARRTRFRPKTGPMLTDGRQKRAKAGTAAARKRAKKLREEWKANPKSHVVDCRFEIERRNCEQCTGRGSTHGSFVAYLPKAIVTDPDQVRSILLLIPGGNGARTRYFLTPIPNKTIYDSMSGGLEVQRHTDEYLAKNPEATPPIVAAINGGGWLTVNGAIEYQTHDVPKKVAKEFLGLSDLSKLAIGADGISSGSRSMLRAYAHKPFIINTVGMTCMHCGGDKGGFLLEEDFLIHNKKNGIFDAWRQMSKAGLFHFHFAIGNRDKYYPCNKEIHSRLVKEGVVKDVEPRYENCREGKRDHRHCDTYWEGFDLHDGQGHHYGLLLDSWVPTLHWHFKALHKTVEAIDSGALTRIENYER